MEEKPIRVLGLDPGTRIAGYGILDIAPGRPPSLVTCGAFRLTAESIPDRLSVLYRDLRKLIGEYEPSVLAVETVFHGKSFQSVLKVGEARGVVLLSGSLHGLEIHEFSPTMVKKVATGNGNAAKIQVQRMIARLLGLAKAPQPADVTDALAIAFCYAQHSWRQKLPQR